MLLIVGICLGKIWLMRQPKLGHMEIPDIIQTAQQSVVLDSRTKGLPGWQKPPLQGSPRRGCAYLPSLGSPLSIFLTKKSQEIYNLNRTLPFVDMFVLLLDVRTYLEIYNVTKTTRNEKPQKTVKTKISQIYNIFFISNQFSAICVFFKMSSRRRQCYTRTQDFYAYCIHIASTCMHIGTYCTTNGQKC